MRCARMRAGADMKLSLGLVAALFAGVVGISAQANARKILSVDHKVTVKSTVPAIAGQPAQIYVRERVAEGMKNPAADRVVLFVHGAGTPAEVAFDVPTGDYSWMAHLAKAGFDAFSMDTTGYGRSTRPAPMNDPCNLSDGAAEAVRADVDPGAVQGHVSGPADDDRLRLERHRRRRRSHPQAAQGREGQHGRVVARRSPRGRLCGAASRESEPPRAARAGLQPRRAPPHTPAAAAARARVFNTQSRSEFDANWDRQVGCENQVDPKVREVVWAEMLASDPTGAKWGSGVRRAPSTTTWGLESAMIGGMKMPTLMIAGAHDKQVPPDRVRAAYDDLGVDRQGADRSRLLVPQRDVGSQSPHDVQRVARMVDERHRWRNAQRRHSSRVSDALRPFAAVGAGHLV